MYVGSGARAHHELVYISMVGCWAGGVLSNEAGRQRRPHWRRPASSLSGWRASTSRAATTRSPRYGRPHSPSTAHASVIWGDFFLRSIVPRVPVSEMFECSARLGPRPTPLVRSPHPSCPLARPCALCPFPSLRTLAAAARRLSPAHLPWSTVTAQTACTAAEAGVA